MPKGDLNHDLAGTRCRPAAALAALLFATLGLCLGIPHQTLAAAGTDAGTTPLAAQADAAPPAVSAQAGRPAAGDESVAELLLAADQAFDADKLIFPAAESALTLYERVLVIDPDNEAARRGIERIVERYLQLALEAARKRRFDAAEDWLGKARLVDRSHPSIKPTALQIRLLQQASRQRLTLDRSQLRARDATLAERLQDFGGEARRPDCHVVIRSGSDADSRWIYQQLAAGPGKSRIRARVERAWPTTVELKCTNDMPS